MISNSDIKRLRGLIAEAREEWNEGKIEGNDLYEWADNHAIGLIDELEMILSEQELDQGDARFNDE